MVSLGGHKLRFWSRIVHAYPDDLVADLIAHELAHVYQYGLGMEDCRGDGRGVTRWNGHEMDRLEVEEDADMKTLGWGFETDAIDEWDLAHGIIKVHHVGRMSPSGVRRLMRELERNGR